MNKVFRVVFVLALLLGFGFLAVQNAALASPPPPIDVTVEPTKTEEPYELGGCVTGIAKAFKPEIELNVALLEEWNSYPTIGLPPMPEYYWDLPGAPADVFSCVVILRIKENGEMVKAFPEGKGSAEVCLETPVGKPGWIYYLDEFKLFSQNPAWVEVGGKFEGGTTGCVPVTKSGVYAFYAPIPESHPAKPVSETVTTTTYVQKGSVKIPVTTTTVITTGGGMQLGGCVTGNIKDVPTDHKIEVSLISKWDPQLPKSVGELYRCVIEVKFFDPANLVENLPVEKGNATICFAVAPQKTGTIYFLNTFFDKNAQWEKVAGPFPTGIACGPVDKSGLYGMVDVQNK